jgi:hypothetical protein
LNRQVKHPIYCVEIYYIAKNNTICCGKNLLLAIRHRVAFFPKLARFQLVHIAGENRRKDMSDQKQQQSHYALAFLLTAITLFSLARPDLLWLLLMPVCLLLLALEKRLHQQPANERALNLDEIQSIRQSSFEANLQALRSAVDTACGETATASRTGLAPCPIEAARRNHQQVEEHLNNYLRPQPAPCLHGIKAQPLACRIIARTPKPVRK